MPFLSRRPDFAYTLLALVLLFSGLFSLAARPALATLTNGENALDLLGAYDSTNFTNPVPIYSKSAVNDGPNIFGFNGATNIGLPIAWDGTNHKLYIGEAGNNRVLVYNLTSGNLLVDHMADNVIGHQRRHGNFHKSSNLTLRK